MKYKVVQIVVLIAVAGVYALGQKSDFIQAVERWNRAYENREVEKLRDLVSSDVTLYEPGVRDVGIKAVFDHLSRILPRLSDMKVDYSDVTYHPGADLALVTRYYKLQAKLEGKDFIRFGNESLVWKIEGGQWKLLNWHLSQPRS